VQSPQTIGPYRIVETLATGGMGVVYRARHDETGHIVALKTAAGLNPGSLGSIRREILALLRLSHPGVVRLVGEGVQDGVPWHAMELLEGRPLREHLEALWKPFRRSDQFATTRHGANAWAETTPELVRAISQRRVFAPPPLVTRPPAGGGEIRRSLTIVRRLCQTLAFLHGEGIVHGDVKPDNVVLRADDTPVLVDFGIMRRMAGAAGREALEVDNEGAGTLAYMAPEQLRTTEIDARADLYAIGCILYEAACGRPPFIDDEHGSIAEQLMRRPPRPPSEIVDRVDPRLEDLILRLLGKLPQERPGYADDVGLELEALGAEPTREFATPAPRPYLYRPSFSGRRELVTLLDEELQAAFKGRGRCVLLTGPSGAGKTRLCLELARRARVEGMRVHSGECTPMSGGDRGAGVPLQAFRPLLQEIADRCRADGVRMTERLLGVDGRILEEIEPAFASVPGHERFAAPPRLPAERSRERIQHSVVEVIARFAGVRPLLVVLDDLQWADDLTLGVLRELVNRPRNMHAIVLVTCRSESAEAALGLLRGAASMVALGVEPLSAHDVERIVAGMTAREDPPSSLVNHLARESAGNPFFVAEYLKAAVAEGLLVRESGHWQFRLHESTPPLVAPGSVQALVARRLDGLGDEARLLVQVGAVLGRTWSADELTAVIARDAADVEISINELIARQILVEEEGEGERLRFVHDKIRETAYDGIDAPVRRHWHARAAEVFARDTADPSLWRRLAYHYQMAGDDAGAFAWAERAGRHAHDAGAYREAREHLEVACALAPKLPPRAPLEQARLHRMYAEALDGVGEIDASGRQFIEALASLGRPLPRSRAGWIALLASQALRQMWLRLAPGTHLAAESRRASLEESAVAASRLVAYYFFRNRIAELMASVTLATNLAEEAGADAPHARAGAFLAGMVGVMGMRGVARGYFTRTREAARRSGDLAAELFQAQVEGMYHLHRADWPSVHAIVEPALARSTSAGAAFETEALRMPAALTALFTGRDAEAQAQAAEMRRSAHALGHRLHETWGRIILAECALRAGRSEESLALVEPTIVELEREGDVVNRLNCLGLIAGARLQLGDLAGALAMAEITQRQIEEQPSAALAPYHLHEHVPAVYLTAWEQGGGTDEMAKLAQLACDRAARYARVGAIARPFALRHQARRSLLVGKPRRARRLLDESVAIARAHSMPYDERLALAALDAPPRLSGSQGGP
jgi:eukaryotic-like serine/threonine-protein kinase